MKKLKYLCLLSILCLCGCTAEYNIVVTNTGIKENVKVYAASDENDALNYYKQNKILAFSGDGADYYYSFKELDNGVQLNFNYLNFKAYSVSSFFNECYDKTGIQTDDEYIYISASDYVCQSYNYFYVTDAKVNLTTKLKVVENNADSHHGNTYTWNLGSEGKDIDVVIKKDIGKNKVKTKKEETSIIVLLSIFGGFVIVLSILIFIGYKKRS